MKGLLSVFAVTAALASPAAATDALTCADFVAFSEPERIAAVEHLEPKSIETNGKKSDAKPDASSGPAGTVDPTMTEADKAAKIAEACDAQPDLTAAEAMHAAFNKPK